VGNGLTISLEHGHPGNFPYRDHIYGFLGNHFCQSFALRFGKQCEMISG
jgi:hypothetical protein